MVEQVLTNEAMFVKEEITSSWNEIVSNPDSLTDLWEKKVVFAAGGGLV